MIFMVTACSSRPSRDRPTTPRTVPINIPQYPNAINGQNRTEASIPGFDNQYLEFQTDDSVDEVLAFYKQYFEQNHWINLSSGYIDRQDSVVYGSHYLQATQFDACPIYGMYVYVKELETGKQQVDTKFAVSPCAVR
jgi:hypothetical protein